MYHFGLGSEYGLIISIALAFCLTCTLKDFRSACLGTTTPLFYYTHSHLWDILYVVIISLRKKVSQWSSSLFVGLPSARMLTFLLVRVSSNVPWGYGINKWYRVNKTEHIFAHECITTQWKYSHLRIYLLSKAAYSLRVCYCGWRRKIQISFLLSNKIHIWRKLFSSTRSANLCDTIFILGSKR